MAAMAAIREALFIGDTLVGASLPSGAEAAAAGGALRQSPGSAGTALAPPSEAESMKLKARSSRQGKAGLRSKACRLAYSVRIPAASWHMTTAPFLMR